MSPVRTLLVCVCSLAVHLDRLPSIRALPPPAHGVPLKSIAFGSCNKEWMDTDAELWESVIKSSPSAWVWMGDAICECTTCHAAAPREFAPANADAASVPYTDASDKQSYEKQVIEKKQAYNVQAAKPGIAQLAQGTPIVGTWDDHDYGGNGSGDS